MSSELNPNSHTPQDISQLSSEDILLLKQKNFKILVAEDNPMNRSLNRILIRNMFPNALILEAHNGLEAVELTASDSPDIVLMDIQMPVMDGYEACSKIRQVETNAQLPIISLTANYLPEDMAQGSGAGFNDFLFKPIVRDSLFNMLIKWLIV